ncbi:MAG TPA: alpha/beta family hydrolase [Candidatus Acidoferrales bacterium]|nr:alpha/beta family hydrolase [Candidatus Acidoferrales bacterium]
MLEHTHRSLFIPGPAGRLEGILWTPSPEAPNPPFAALVCHPHPLYGGSMHNKVVYQVNKTLDRLGLPVLRFNFRGVGRSEGAHDNGRGECEDVRAGFDFLAAEFHSAPLLLAGFSFGCLVGLRAGCEDVRVAELIGLGAPVDGSDFSYLKSCAKPKLFLQGDHDQFGARAKLEALVGSLPGTNELIFVPDADHFFSGKLDQVDAALASWFTSRHPSLTAI